MITDLRYTLRQLANHPGFAIVTVLTLGLGIGGITALVTLVNAVVLRPLHYPDSDRLVSVGHALPGVGIAEAGQSEGTYQHYREHNRAFDQMGVYLESFVNLTTEGAEPERIRVALVTPSVFTMLGATAYLGRLLTVADADNPNGGVLISHGLWIRRYGADPEIVGTTIELNLAHAPDGSRGRREVLGVLPPDFDFPRRDTQVWYSIAAEATRARLRDLYLTGIARLRPGVAPEEGEADLRRLIPSLADSYADATPELLESSGLRPVVTPLKEQLVGDIAGTLWIVLGGVAFLLVVACANVANLFLVRAEHRRREVALRAALGAGRRRIIRHFMTESALIAALGGILGLFLADTGVQLLIAAAPGDVPRLHEVRIDGFVLAFVAGVTLMSSVLFTAVSVLRQTHSDATSSLRDAAGRTADPVRQRAHRLLVASQMALALVLTIGSALMVQSLRELHRVDLGFDPKNVLTFQPSMSFALYPRYRDAAALQVRLLDRLRALPGVLAAEASSDLPLTAGPSVMDVEFAADGTRFDTGELGMLARFAFATRGYFEAMGIPLLAGRAFQPGDLEAPAVILSAGFARAIFPGIDPIGRRIRLAEWPDDRPYTVVGVVGDVAGESLADGPMHHAYFPVLADRVDSPLPFVPRESMNIIVRTDHSPMSFVPLVRQVMAEIDPRLPVERVRTMEQIAADSMARLHFAMVLIITAAVATLFLGVIGMYGVVSYAVRRRTREIGVRIALGARSAQVKWMVLQHGAAVAVGSLALGIVAALALTRFLRALLFGVSATDPAIFIAMSVLLFSVALLATYLPARRATRIDPMEALRHE